MFVGGDLKQRTKIKLSVLLHKTPETLDKLKKAYVKDSGTRGILPASMAENEMEGTPCCGLRCGDTQNATKQLKDNPKVDQECIEQRKKTLEVARDLPPLFPFYQPRKNTCGSTSSTPCRKGTIHLQTSMSSPGSEPSSCGTAASVANHYTGWVTVS
ncbi:hypothetical protein TNCV_2989181 [Trichonephila clavipes]|nr:hypothetical protein TNCV_2989181 [Trichonephila clavipes]